MVVGSVREDERFDEFISYFESNFIGRQNRAGDMIPPRYAPQQWSQYQNVLNDHPRTNNRVEGWNRRANELADCSHPHVFKLVQIVKQDMLKSHNKIQQANAGQDVPHQRRRCTDLNQRIKNLVTTSDLQQNSTDELIIECLTRFAHIINY